ncbi:hypothetical protein [Actinomycetospora cinnamomea]|uniref:Tail protein P2 I n=1 Tax=Actinomycetospora cinnamomea TaxID=663609 RepID=A0A2U1F7Q4_9PSEU|nr:hypothetical protein [Actinomycetospora cinnamomea]PVZ08206.1 hypothetical protein C8D89_10989 [Actinomycetospora cinnamomea]
MTDRLHALLPALHRIRDDALGEPLRGLLGVIEEQVDLVEDNLWGLYANWFVETADDWVLPYLGDLVGYRPVADLPGPALRRDLAGTLGARRRKGTLALLEELALDVAGWPARAVEFRTQLAGTAPVRLLDAASRPLWTSRGRTADLRDGQALAELDGPFDTLAHTTTVGRLASRRTVRRHHRASVGLFVWRLRAYQVSGTEGFCIDEARRRFMVSVLGHDLPLIHRPLPEPDPTHIADAMNVPGFLTRRGVEAGVPDVYGPTGSVFVWRDAERSPVPADQVVIADLRDWSYRPRGEEMALDPVLGRIAFSRRGAPEHGIRVRYHYGAPGDLGGGEYRRPAVPAVGDVLKVGEGAEHADVAAALAAWRAVGTAAAVVEIVDSGLYEEPLAIDLAAGQRLEVRAAPGTRPVIRLLNRRAGQPDSLRVRGPARDGEPATLVLDGLLVTGRGLWVSGHLDRVEIRHCTLVPGWSLEETCAPAEPGRASVELSDTGAALAVSHSIVGPLVIDTWEPVEVSVCDSVVDPADDPDGDPDDQDDADSCVVSEAISGQEGRASALLSVVRATVLGGICTHTLTRAENSIIMGRVRVARRQHGCVRFCWVPTGSRTPRRYQCQPDLVRAAVDPADPAGADRETQRVTPRFTAVHYGAPAYTQLALDCAPEITEGAEDRSEMGVWHDLFIPQRLAALRARLDEFTPAASDAGVVIVT